MEAQSIMTAYHMYIVETAAYKVSTCAYLDSSYNCCSLPKGDGCIYEITQVNSWVYHTAIYRIQINHSYVGKNATLMRGLVFPENRNNESWTRKIVKLNRNTYTAEAKPRQYVKLSMMPPYRAGPMTRGRHRAVSNRIYSKIFETLIKLLLVKNKTTTVNKENKKSLKFIHLSNLKLDRPKCLVKPELETETASELYDMTEEYDPERPYHGRPNQIMGDKVPFTGYFDPIEQRYTIENFDSAASQTREGIEPSIILPEKPDFIKRLEAIPLTGNANTRMAEINEYLKHNHHVTYASLQNPNGQPGQIPWAQPPRITQSAQIPSSLRGDGLMGQVQPGKPEQPSYAGPAVSSTNTQQVGQLGANNPGKNQTQVVNEGYKTSREVPASRVLKDPRIKQGMAAKAGIIAKMYKTNMPISQAASTMTVCPLELATKPVHKPAMERINRHVQLAQKQGTTKADKQKPDLSAWTALQGRFCKSKPNMKPKGSRNIPISLAKMTDVPANCWPLVEAQEANTNMWTQQHTPPPSPPPGELEALKQIVRPVSPMAESVNNDHVPKPSSPVKENLAKTSLEIQTLTREHLAKLPGVTLTPVKPIAKATSTIVRPAQTSQNATITRVDSLKRKPTMSDNDSMDLDSTFIAGEKRANDSDSEAPKAKKTTMQALAIAYKARVDETKNKLVLKKGGGPINPQPSLEGNVETEFFNEVVKVSDKPIAKTSYATAPLVTLRQLMPAGVVEDGPQDFESIPLDQTFRAGSLVFIVMIKPLPKPGNDPNVSWEMPDSKFFGTKMNEAFAEHIEPNITRMDALKWSSVATTTGVGAFSAVAEQLELVQIFREILRKKVYAGHMAESFPKQTLLNNYGITLYAHGGSIAYRAPILLAMLLRTHQADFKGQCEVLKHDKFPGNHPIIKKQNARIISLLPDQEFLDHLQKFPSNYPFKAGFLNRLFIRGGVRIDPKDPDAKKVDRRPKFGRAAISKLLLANQDEILKKGAAEQDMADQMEKTTL